MTTFHETINALLDKKAGIIFDDVDNTYKAVADEFTYFNNLVWMAIRDLLPPYFFR